uniref:Shiftless antiviral inhibitor of ribosomal frameshifting protein homolog n=1 Tax=Petromyzon marinus TaxID=7757 RepID=A0AAJ7XJG2_PETMA
VVFAVQVSQCRSCNRKYQPVPRDREWGSGALFNCTTCDNTFRLTATKGTACMCVLIAPTRTALRALPGSSSAAWPRTATTPRCGESLRSVCFVHREHAWQGPRVPGTHCVHARTLHVTRRVTCCVHASEPHVSSASTVATCISQGSLVEHEDVLIEQDLLEEDENRRH